MFLNSSTFSQNSMFSTLNSFAKNSLKSFMPFGSFRQSFNGILLLKYFVFCLARGFFISSSPISRVIDCLRKFKFVVASSYNGNPNEIKFSRNTRRAMTKSAQSDPM
eukprot:NODE_249_length_12946_cov_0.357438.p13 type:complete len:107 gc:universal NODE_249_length_12946_cov_0.357438:4899-4579(-)